MEKDKSGRYLTLFVPGLAENRPSVLRGDTVKVKVTGDPSVGYEGIVHEVQDSNLLIGFGKKLLQK